MKIDIAQFVIGIGNYTPVVLRQRRERCIAAGDDFCVVYYAQPIKLFQCAGAIITCCIGENAYFTARWRNWVKR